MILHSFGAWRSLVSALGSGPRGRGFKSPRPDHLFFLWGEMLTLILTIIDFVSFILSLYFLKRVEFDYKGRGSWGALLLPLFVTLATYVGIVFLGSAGLSLSFLLMVLIAFYYATSPIKLLGFFEKIKPIFLLLLTFLLSSIAGYVFNLFQYNLIDLPFWVAIVVFLLSLYILVLSKCVLVSFCSIILEKKGYKKEWAVPLAFLNFVGLLIAILLKPSGGFKVA